MTILSFLNKFFSFIIVALVISLSVIYFVSTNDDAPIAVSANTISSIQEAVATQATPTQDGEQKTLKKLPAFQLNNIASHDLSDRVMILNFFSMWCIDCKRENVILNEFKKTYNIPIYGVNVFIKDEDNQKAFFKNYGDPFKKWGKDDFRLIPEALKFSAIPVTLIITPDRVIHWRHDGELNQHIIENEMVPLLKELSKPHSILSLTDLPTSPPTPLPHSDATQP